ncbi:MAG: hypothetical protein ACREAE_03035 [Nitrosopumilaceae archaeon]
MEKQPPSTVVKKDINYYVVAGIFLAIIIYEIGNEIEPDIDSQLDFFEATRLLGFAAVAIFAFVIARRYRGSEVFGKAYLALGIGYAFYFAGDLLWYVYEIGYQVANPYPYYPDIGYFGTFPFLIYHLKTNIHYFKRKLDKYQKFILAVLPIGTSLAFTFVSLVPLEAPGGLTTIRIAEIPPYEPQYFVEFLTGLAYVAIVTITLSLAITGFQVFRGGILGPAWGLLLVGFLLETFADLHYYYYEIFGDYARTSPVHGIWMASTIILCYALYKHKAL